MKTLLVIVSTACVTFFVTKKITPATQTLVLAEVADKDESYRVEPNYKHCGVCGIGIISEHTDNIVRCSHCGHSE